jgi:sulfate transport system ATP-binding protein
MSIEVQNVSKRFGEFVALRGVSLSVPTGELVALLGPSGSGKTTLLRIISGLEPPDSGAVFFDGQETTHRAVQERGVGFVFQHYALFRHMTVFENVAFGLRVKPRRERPSKEQIGSRVLELLQLVQLAGHANHYPAQLSGGQRQRVALARALAVQPKVLLLDEPFGSLDAKVRQELRRWLRHLHDELHVTSIFVTHDQEEALEVADRVVVINQGQIEQEGQPEVVYHHPANAFVYQFLGNLNLFHARFENGETCIGEPASRIVPGGPNAPSLVYVRPHLMKIERTASDGNHLSARITRINSAGPLVHLELAAPGGETIHADIAHERFEQLNLTVGEEVFVSPRDMKVFGQDRRSEGKG